MMKNIARLSVMAYISFSMLTSAVAKTKVDRTISAGYETGNYSSETGGSVRPAFYFLAYDQKWQIY